MAKADALSYIDDLIEEAQRHNLANGVPHITIADEISELNNIRDLVDGITEA